MDKEVNFFNEDYIKELENRLYEKDEKIAILENQVNRINFYFLLLLVCYNFLVLVYQAKII